MIPESRISAEDVDPARLATADRLGYELVRFLRLMSRMGSQVAAHQKDGVESAAYALLAHLVLDGPRRTTALADAVHSDTSTVSRQIGALVKVGFVERRQDPADGRACLLAATDHGRQVFEHNRRRRDAHLAEMVGDWSQAEFDRFVVLLDRFNSDFEGYRERLLAAVREPDTGEDGHTRHDEDGRGGTAGGDREP